MEASHDIPLRSTRDHLIDLLGIGECYPLSDLNIFSEQLTVPYGDVATIPIENAQVGVVYQLCDPAGKPLGEQYQAEGQGGTLLLDTPKVVEDISYRILATKYSDNTSISHSISVCLDTPAKVKVGIDTKLKIQILDAPLLDTGISNPQPSDPRVIAYGKSVQVQIDLTQEGVDYSLLLDGKQQSESEKGDLGNIMLNTGPVYEDTVIQVQATKVFPKSQKRAPDIGTLDTTLYLKVLADPDVAVSVTPTPIVDYLQASMMCIEKPQANVTYKAYLCPIMDSDFVRGSTDIGDIGITKVAVADHDVRVLNPALKERWYLPEGFSPLKNESPTVSKDTVEFTLDGMTDDSLIIVQAIKQHQVAKDTARTIATSIRLNSAAAVLVRPDPKRVLNLLLLTGKQGDNKLQVSGGQPGVFYYFRPSTGKNEFPQSVYFHKRDIVVETQNKGLDQLAIEVDFVLTADMVDGYPPLPSLDNVPYTVGTKLAVRAMKAQTGVETNMDGSVTVEDGAKANA